MKTSTFWIWIFSFPFSPTKFEENFQVRKIVMGFSLVVYFLIQEYLLFEFLMRSIY